MWKLFCKCVSAPWYRKAFELHIYLSRGTFVASLIVRANEYIDWFKKPLSHNSRTQHWTRTKWIMGIRHYALDGQTARGHTPLSSDRLIEIRARMASGKFEFDESLCFYEIGYHNMRRHTPFLLFVFAQQKTLTFFVWYISKRNRWCTAIPTEANANSQQQNQYPTAHGKYLLGFSSLMFLRTEQSVIEQTIIWFSMFTFRILPMKCVCAWN